MNTDAMTCQRCHADDLEIICNEGSEAVILCHQCGLARLTTRTHLLAS